MSKKKKEHRKRVEARNRRIEQERKQFRQAFQEEVLKMIELQKQKNAENNPETQGEVAQ